MLFSFGIKQLLFCLGFCLQLVICHSQVCIPTWTPYSRSYSIGGSLRSSVRLLQDCLARCERLNTCVAVDFELSSTVYCWLHNNMSNLIGNNFQADAKDNVTQYRINRNCTNYGKGPECPVQWIQNTSIGSYSGQQVNYWTEYDCFTYCLHSNSCAAVYYDNGTSPPCWIHNELDQKNNGDGVVQYRLNKTCPSSASSSSLQIGRCVGQYFPSTSWCPPGAKIHIVEAWFKVNPLCCYRNAEDAYPPDASWLHSVQVPYLDPAFFNEINSSCEGQSDCKSSIRAKPNSALDQTLHCLDDEIGTNYVSITYQCKSKEITTSGEMKRTTGGTIGATASGEMTNTAAGGTTGATASGEMTNTAAGGTTGATTATTATTSSTVQTNIPDDYEAARNDKLAKENSHRLIIGLVVGLGVPLILSVIIVTVVVLLKRRKRKYKDEPMESYRVDGDFYTSETMPRGTVPEYEVNEISMTADAL